MTAWTVRSLAEEFRRATAGDRRELARLRADPHLRPEAQAELTKKIEERLAEGHAQVVARMAEQIAEGRADYVDALPAVAQLRAAAAQPDRAGAVRGLAEMSAPRDLARLAEELVGARDLAGAHGVRSALARRDDLDDAARAAVLERLDAIGHDRARGALAELVGSQAELADFQVRGPEDSEALLLREPMKLLTIARAAQVVPTDAHGGQRHLSDAEVRELREAAGVPPRPAA